jgi:hypothetical protein
LYFSEIIVKCVFKLASYTGVWIAGSAFFLSQYIDDPVTLAKMVQEVFFPTGMEVVAIFEGSIKIMLWTKKLDALDEFWKR